MAGVTLIRSVASFTSSSLYTAQSLLAFSSPTLVVSSSTRYFESCRPAPSSSSSNMMSKSTGSLEVVQFPCLGDNYGWVRKIFPMDPMFVPPIHPRDCIAYLHYLKYIIQLLSNPWRERIIQLHDGSKHLPFFNINYMLHTTLMIHSSLQLLMFVVIGI